MAERNIQEFYADNIPTALENCAKAGYEALFMPELVEQRIKAEIDSPLWQNWYTTRSTIETGKTSASSKIVLISHIPGYLSEAENIQTAINAGLRVGAGFVPEDNFQQRVKRAEQGEPRLFIIPYEKVRASPSRVISVDSALEHPLVLPFLGVSKARAGKYFEKHKQIYSPNVGVWHYDDFVNGETRGRVLFLGSNYDILYGFNLLNYYARFVGVRRASDSEQEVPAGHVAQKSAQAAEIVQGYTPQEITAALNQLKLSGLEAQILAELKKRKK